SIRGRREAARSRKDLPQAAGPEPLLARWLEGLAADRALTSHLEAPEARRLMQWGGTRAAQVARAALELPEGQPRQTFLDAGLGRIRLDMLTVDRQMAGAYGVSLPADEKLERLLATRRR